MSLNFELSQEHKLARQAVSDMLDKYESRRTELDQMLKDQVFQADLWQDFAEVGLLGCLIPEEYGGNGMGMLAQTLGFEEICCHGFSPGILLVTAMDSACIAAFAPEDLKKRILPGVADGSIRLCFAITEPNAGTNTFRMETIARRKGDVYVVNGQKTFISGVDFCEYMLLVVRTTTVAELEKKGLPKAHGLSMMLVDTSSAGMEKHEIPIASVEGVRQFTLFFDDMEVPVENLIGEEDNGLMAMFNSLNPERILAAAICNGMADNAIRRAVVYANERKVFKNTPIGAYQSLAHPLAEAKIMLEAGRLMSYRAAWAYDEGRPPGEVGTMSNMAKFLSADNAFKAVDAAIETHGGNGFTEEFGLLRMLNGARLLKTAPISREMLLNYVAEWELGLPKSY